MALLQIGASGGGIMNALGNNSIASALGISSGNMSPSTFATKFGTQSIFTASSLPYIIRTNKNFDVIFHWYPKRSQIRSYFANAFSSSDTDELGIFIRKVDMQSIKNNAVRRGEAGNRLGGTLPGDGVGSSAAVDAFSMDILSTEFSLVDHCFYQWLRETESPYWIYGPTMSGQYGYGSIPHDFAWALQDVMGRYVKGGFEQDKDGSWQWVYKAETPNKSVIADGIDDATALISCLSTSEIVPFTRADVEIKYYSGNQTPLHSVIFYGAFPVSIESMSVDHSGDFKESYKVNFACDSVDISSPFVAEEGSWAGKAQQWMSDTLGKIGIESNTAKWTAGLQEDILTNYANAWLAKASRLLNKTTNKAGGKLNDTLLNAQKSLGV